MGRKNPSLLRCDEVRGRIYPLLLRTLSEQERRATLDHTAECEACLIAVTAVRGRLQHIEGIPTVELEDRRRERRPGRRLLWLFLASAVPTLFAYALLLNQGLQMARYRQETRFLSRVERALHRYREDFGDYPPDNGAPLAVYLATQERNGPYLELGRERLDAAGRFLDAWGNPWVYRYPGSTNPRLFDLQSFGVNGRDDQGRRDDLANWE